MTGRPTRLSLIAAATLCGVLTGCETHSAVMQATRDTVVVSYAGDIAETLPLAKKHCAQYERTPVLRETKPNTAIYTCVTAN